MSSWLEGYTGMQLLVLGMLACATVSTIFFSFHAIKLFKSRKKSPFERESFERAVIKLALWLALWLFCAAALIFQPPVMMR
jgi:heme O synthase-like polyprenyltransferase